MDLSSGWNRSAGPQGRDPRWSGQRLRSRICRAQHQRPMDCTVRTLFVNFKMLRSLLPIAEDRDSTNHSRAGSVVQDLSIGESGDQMRPLIIRIPNQIATSTSSIKSKLAISISS